MQVAGAPPWRVHPQTPERCVPKTTVVRQPKHTYPDSPILRAKLDRPNLGRDVLQRPRLLAALAAHAERPVTLVVSEAGFGKTVLLASYVAGLRRPVLWYSLMPSDADAVVFGSYLVAGLRQEMPRQARALERTLAELRSGNGVSRFGAVFASVLAARRGPPLLVVLDDFHEVAGDPAVVAVVDSLLRHLPASARVLMSSRTVPPLGLDRMRTRNEVFDLDSSHLRYTREELAELFRETYDMALDEADTIALETATQGWPTAVHLVREAMRRSPDRALENILSEFRTSALELQDYLSNELYSRFEPDERNLLERLVTPDRFDASLAATLSGLREVRPVLQRLAQRGVLRSFGSSGETTYQMQDLVRNFLQRRLIAERGIEVLHALERDTASALAARGETEQALRHFLLAGAAEEATELVIRLARPMLRQGRAGTLLQCLLDLPEAVVESNLELLVTLADCRQLLGQWDDAERLYEQAMDRCRAAGARALECRVLLGQTKVLNMRGHHAQVLGLAERGLAMAAGLDLETQIRLLQRKAGAHFYLGQYAAAVRILDEVRRKLPGSADQELVVPTIHNLAMALAASGKFREAANEFGAALACVRGAPSPRAPLYLSNLAFLLAELGELADARAAAEEGLRSAQAFSNRAQEITCREALAQVLAQSGDLDGALAELRTADGLNREQRMDVIAGDLLALRGRIFCIRGQYRRAVGFLEEALARLGAQPDQPRFTEFTATLAWCELRAGRARVAHDRLLPLVGRADAEENEFQRMRVHYWLAESLIALGEPAGVEDHLATALRLVRERGYGYFLELQAGEDATPLLRALQAGVEIDTVSAALVEAGTAIEAPLLAMLAKASPASAEAIVAILGEVGGAPTAAQLGGITQPRRALQAAARTAQRHIEARLSRGTAAPTRSATARLELFGTPRLLIDGRPVPASTWRSQRAFLILVHLAIHPHGAIRDQLLDAFWPPRRLAAARKNFHPTLSYIRRVLPATGVPPLLRENETYRLNPGYPMSCDVWDLQRAFEQARLAPDDASRHAALSRALALTRQPYLEGCYEDWASEAQSAMRDRLERAHLELGSLLDASGAVEEALANYRAAAQFDAYRESTRAAIIECLVRLGNRRAALVEWERLKSLLHEELAVDPLPETASRVARALGADADPRLAKHVESVVPQHVTHSAQVRLKTHPAG